VRLDPCNCNSRQLLPKVKNQSWLQHGHKYTEGLSRATTKESTPLPQRARFDSTWLAAALTQREPDSYLFFGPSQVASPLAQFRTEPSTKDSVRCEAPSDTDVFVSREPRIPHENSITHRRSVRIEDQSAKKVRFVQ